MARINFKNLFTSVNEIEGLAREAKKELEKLKIERDEVANAPPARADWDDWISYYVRKSADFYRHEFCKYVPNAMNKARKMAPGEEPQTGMPNHQMFRPGLDGPATMASFEGMLCLAFPDALKTAINTVLDEYDFSNAGLPLKQRKLKLAELDHKIADLEKELHDVSEKSELIGTTLRGQHEQGKKL